MNNSISFKINSNHSSTTASPLKQKFQVTQVSKNINTNGDILFNSSIELDNINIYVADLTNNFKIYNKQLKLLKQVKLKLPIKVCSQICKDNFILIGETYPNQMVKLKIKNDKIHNYSAIQQEAICQATNHSGNYYFVGTYKTVQVWDYNKNIQIAKMSGHPGHVNDLCIINNHTLASCGDFEGIQNGRVLISDLRLYKNTIKYEMIFQDMQLQYISMHSMSHNDKYNKLGVSMDKGLLGICDIIGNRVCYYSDEQNSDFYAINCINSSFIYGGSKKMLNYYDFLKEEESEQILTIEGAVSAIKKFEDNRLVVSDFYGNIRLYDYKQFQ